MSMTDEARAAGPRVLLVEEEALVRMVVADMLEEAGCRVAAQTGIMAEALALARNAEFDLAILDVLVNGELIYPVADIVAARKRPVAFATGFARDDLAYGYRDRPLLRKPIGSDALEGVLAALLAPPP